MATATRTKSLLAVRGYPLDVTALVPAGAVVTSVEMLVSRASPPAGLYPLQTTTLAAPVAVGDGTVSLTANPQKGARLILDPGAGAEEILKVRGVAGTGPFTAQVTPLTWNAHSIGAVSYEPGVNARLCVNDAPTPNGNILMPLLQKGTHGQKYRVSYLFTLNNGEEREDEFLLEVLDPAGVGPNIKQPSETVFIAADFSKRLGEAHQAGATLSAPAVAYVSSNLSSFTTQLAAQANAGSSTISLVAHPGVGAMLVLTPAGTGSNPPERVYVTAVSGSGPYTATITNDLEFQHSNGADVTVFQGFSSAFLSSPTSTIQGLFTVNQARRGQSGKTLKVVWVTATSQAETLQTTALCSIEDL